MKCQKFFSLCLSMGMITGVLPQAVSAEDDLGILQNTGFEAVSNAGEIFWWQTTSGESSLNEPQAEIEQSSVGWLGKNGAHIYNRSAATAGVKQYYNIEVMQPSAEYEVKAYIRYSGETAPDSIEFLLMFGNNYGWSSVKMASAVVKKDRWCEIKGYFTSPEELQNGYVYISTNETEGFVDYYVDDFTITADPYVVQTGDFIENGSFDDGSTAPWFGFGGGTLTAADGSMQSAGRAASWVGPGQTLSKKLRGGHRYKISADVKYDAGSDVQADVNLTLINEADGTTNYYTLMSAAVQGGAWQHTENILTLPEDILDSQTVYFGTSSDEQLNDIFVDNVSITEIADDGTLAKTPGNANPLISHRFGADPFAMEYNGRLYIYLSSDKYEYDADGNLVSNSFAELKSIEVISTSDMVNWTDHGEIPVGGAESASDKTYYEGLPNGGAKWAGLSWAPAAAHKTINGEEKFFLYFANAGGGIGVLEGDSPTGPFYDPTVDDEHPYGTSIVDRSRAIPGTEKVMTYYDPAVFIDDDGQGYLYFGGGFADDGNPESYNHPESVCVIKLSDDMTSTVGDAAAIDAPGLFEDSGIHKYNGKYYYSYSSNFENGKGMDIVDPGTIYYLVSDSPMGPFESPIEGEPAGKVLDNMYVFFKTGGNNHHAIFEFRDTPYIVYHAETLGLAVEGDSTKLKGYRTPHINKLEYDENNVIKPVIADYKGVEQLEKLNPYEKIEAETIAWNSGITVEAIETPDICICADMKVRALKDGGYVSVAGADFGSEGANGFKARVRSEERAHIEIRLDSFNGELVGIADIEPTDGWTDISCGVDNISGVHDVYIVLRGSGEKMPELDYYSFSSDEAPSEPDELKITASAERVDNNINVTVRATKSINDKVLLTGLYSDDGELIKLMKVPTEGLAYNSLYVVFENKTEASYAKVFVWDGTEKMMPAADAAVTVIK